MTVFAGTGADVPGFVVFRRQLPAGDGQAQHQAGEVAVEHQIAATAKNEAGLALQGRHGGEGRQLCRCGDGAEEGGASRQGQGVEGLQVGVGLQEGGQHGVASGRAEGWVPGEGRKAPFYAFVFRHHSL